LLSFVLGPSGYGKTHTVISEIKRILDMGTGKKIFVIVPEQESVKMEAELLEVCGNRINADVEVINFSRLANRVFRESGGMTYKYIDSSGKDLMTAVILERLKSTCKTFSKVSDDTKYVQLMRSEMDLLRSHGIHASDMVEAADKLFEMDKGGKSLHSKLVDFAVIFASYEKSLKENCTDTTDDIVRLAATLEDFDFFEDSYVFVDGFYDYTAPQYSVLESIMKSCADMTVTFSLALPDTEEVFRKTALAYTKLRECAEKNGLEYKTLKLEENKRSESEALRTLSEVIMTGEELHSESSEGITLTSVKTAYDECVFVAREIVRLVRDGAAFSDIAVCAANIDSYSSTLTDVFEAYGISHLRCTEKSVMQSPIVSFVLSALDVINSSFYWKNIKSYLKSPYTGLSEEETYLLENYITVWTLGKKNWYSEEDWTYHPRGYVENFTRRDTAELEIVNTARKKIFPHLKKLAAGISEMTPVRDKAMALVHFFDGLGLSEEVERFNTALGESLGVGDYDDEISAWNNLVDALDIFVSGAGELTLSRDKFIKYLRLILSDMSFGKIPSSLDEVEVGNVEFVRSKNIKHLFFIGFNEGVFPSAGDTKSVFTESERRWLYENDIKVEDSSEDKLKDQMFHFLLSVLRPSKALHLVYHTASDNKKSRSLPSYFATYVTDTVNIEATVPDTSEPLSPHELMDYLMTHDEDLSRYFDSEETASFLRETNALKAFSEAARQPFHIDSDKDIIPGEYKLTQSKLEKYEKCRFSYFVEHMLGVRTRQKAEFSKAEIGSYVHKILEKVLKKLSSDGRDVTLATEEEIRRETELCSAEYIETVAPNINESSPKYKYLIANISYFVVFIINNIKEKFKASLFRPKYFEENISHSDVVKPYEVALFDGTKLTFGGVVDRVDSYTDENGREYIRVVDYKTKSGGKSFSLEDVLNGINLQMLIYLYAFTSSPSDTERREAGIMYMPAMNEEFSPTDTELSDDEIRDIMDKKLKRSGMYLDDREIIDAMESGKEKRYVSLKYDKEQDIYLPNSYSTLATLEEFGLIRRYIDSLFDETVKNIKCGNIEANPIEEENSEGSACAYCPYHPICRYEGDARERLTSEFPLKTMKEMLDRNT